MVNPSAASTNEGEELIGVRIEATAPGCVIGAFDRSGTRLQRTYGLANLDAGTPVDARTRFELGSASKQFTALAILILEAEGRLRRTDPVGKHLPLLPPALRAPTLDQLMRHTSGLPDYIDLARLALGPAFAVLTPGVRSSLLRPCQRCFSPGQTTPTATPAICFWPMWWLQRPAWTSVRSCARASSARWAWTTRT